MKKIISLSIIIVFIFSFCNLVNAHNGNKDTYNGHYVNSNGKWVSYHYHDGEYKGFQLNFIDSACHDGTDNSNNPLNEFKPFNPNETYTFGTWVTVIFDDCDNVIETIPIPTESEPSTDTDTDTVTVTETCTEPKPTITEIKTATTEPIENSSDSVVNTPDSTNIQNITKITAKPTELPRTGESNNALIVLLGCVLSLLGIYSLIKYLRIKKII